MLAATALDLEARRRAAPRRPPPASPAGGRRRSGRGPPRRASRRSRGRSRSMPRSPVPLAPPSLSFSLENAAATLSPRPNNMPPMRAPRLVPALPCLLAAALLAGCGGGSGTGDSTAAAAQSAKSRPAPPKIALPERRGQTLREVLKAADGPVGTGHRTGGGSLLPGREPLPVRGHRADSSGPVDDARSRDLLRQGAGTEAGGEIEIRQPRPGRESPRTGARPPGGRARSRPRSKPSRRSRSSRARPPPKTPKPPASSTRPSSICPSEGEWQLAAILSTKTAN